MKIVISKSNLIKALIFSLSFVAFFVGMLILYNWHSFATRFSIKPLVFLLYSLSLTLILKRNDGEFRNTIPWSFVLLCLVATLTATIRVDVAMAIAPMIFLCAFMLICNRKVDKCFYFRIISVSYLSVCIFSVLWLSVGKLNSQGVLFSFAGVTLLNMLCFYRKRSFLLLGLIFGGVFTILTITGSRISILAFFVATVISYAYLFFNQFSLKKLLLRVFVVVTIGVFYSQIENLIQQVFFQKWEDSVELSSGRVLLWEQTLDNASLLGGGINFLGFFSDRGYAFDAHNSFIQAIGCYGYLMIVPMILLIVGITSKIKKTTNKIIYINFFSSWTIVSMFESLELFTTRMIPSTILFAIYLAMLYSEEQHIQKAYKPIDSST